MPRRSQAVRSAIAISVVVAAAAAGMVLASARRGDTRGPAAPGLRANLLPDAVDGSPAPTIRLRDARGRRVDTTRLDGRPYLVTFLYTHCTDVCPVIGFEIADALRRLGARAHRVAALGVSVDPRGDTPVAARRWVADHRLPTAFRYALGSAGQLRPIWRDWFVVPRDGTLADPRAHDASVWLVDARGRLRGRWSGAEPIAPEDIAHDLGVLLDEAHG
jgi:protein SCO1/2